MNKQTFHLILLAGAAAAAYFLFIKKGGTAPQMTGGSTSDAVAIAKLQSDAAVAQAKAAADIAKAQQSEWYTPLLEGVGKGTGQFLGGLSGLLG